MAKRRRYSGWTCEKCGRRFKVAGRHAAACTGKRAAAATVALSGENGHRRGRRVRATAQHSGVITITTERFREMIETFERASKGLVAMAYGLLSECGHYRSEAARMAAGSAKWDQVRAVLDAPAPVVALEVPAAATPGGE